MSTHSHGNSTHDHADSDESHRHGGDPKELGAYSGLVARPEPVPAPRRGGKK